MGQIGNILKGWESYLKGGASDMEKKRAEICKACIIDGKPGAVLGTYEQLMMDFELKEIQGLKCNVCKCPLSTKLRVKDEKCPLGKW